MSNNIHTQKHLTLSDRIFIETSLNNETTFKEIAKTLKKDPTTISKEIKKHRILSKRATAFNMPLNDCVYVQNCGRLRICKNSTCKTFCKTAKNCLCTTKCSDYVKCVCSLLNKPPYVCNGCDNRRYCRRDKYFYHSKDADAQYNYDKSTSRQGINMSAEARSALDNLISPLIKQRQPLDHIIASHKDEIPCSKRTIYRYVENGILSVKNIDLVRKVRYKIRKSHKNHELIPREYFAGRTYKDFFEYIEKNPDTDVVEMDTVHGCRDSKKVLLTMLFRSCSFMLIFLLDDAKCESVSKVFDSLKENLSENVFKHLFPVLLPDRGSEFSDPETLENDKHGNKLSHLFFCDPCRPGQKGRLEKNHEFIRYVLPKKISFDNLTQEDITLLTNHINSTARASLNGSTPFKLASFFLDPKLFELLDLKPIEPDNVLLKPLLLKKH